MNEKKTKKGQELRQENEVLKGKKRIYQIIHNTEIKKKNQQGKIA